MGDLKYRVAFSSTLNKGLYKAFYNFSVDEDSYISKMLDEAVEDYLKKHNIPYEKTIGIKRRKK